MSKRELKKYLSTLSAKQAKEQIIDLYDRFKNVKEFYDFAFNPKEDKLIERSKFLISKEYFPVNGRKSKLRRSVAHKQIKQFILLGVRPELTADIMLFNIEIAQSYCAENRIKSESFYMSMLKSFEEALAYMQLNSLLNDFAHRLTKIVDNTWEQDWINKAGFERVYIESRQAKDLIEIKK